MVILRAYVDESYVNGKAKTLCGFLARPEEWRSMGKKWKRVLDCYGAPYFHFREFNQRPEYCAEQNPYRRWSAKQRHAFLYDLALVISESAIPIGSYADLHQASAGDCVSREESLIRKLYSSVEIVLQRHWPDSRRKVDFVFDDTPETSWKSLVRQVHREMQKSSEVGSITFEDDKRHSPLQAADLIAAIDRQNAERFCASGKTDKQPNRVLDWILTRNRFPRTKDTLSNSKWVKLVRSVMRDEQFKLRRWGRTGEQKRKYYVEIDFDFEKHGYSKLIRGSEDQNDSYRHSVAGGQEP